MSSMQSEHLAAVADINGLFRKLATLPEPTVSMGVCCWTDLLGFGEAFTNEDWHPCDDTWQKIAGRIVDAHIECYRNLDPATEFVLTLNDGIVRCCDADRFQHLDYLSMWLRACIWTHNNICDNEAQKQLPGARTVIAAGPALRYSPVSITYDDFVYLRVPTSGRHDGSECLPCKVLS
jgi:hypothetical protein